MRAHAPLRRMPLLPPPRSSAHRSPPPPADHPRTFLRPPRSFHRRPLHRFARTSPESEPRRARRHCLTAGARRSPLRPCHHHQSTPGELNHALVPLVAPLRPSFAAGELAPAGEGTVVRVKILGGPLCKFQGPFHKRNDTTGTSVEIDSSSFSVMC